MADYGRSRYTSSWRRPSWRASPWSVSFHAGSLTTQFGPIRWAVSSRWFTFWVSGGACMATRRQFIQTGLGMAAGAALAASPARSVSRVFGAVEDQGPTPLDGAGIPHFVDPLPVFTMSKSHRHIAHC